MQTKLDPILSEFDTVEERNAYDRWYRAKVERALNSPHPCVSHDEVMDEVDAIIEAEARSHRVA